jgi:hypothetical protein
MERKMEESKVVNTTELVETTDIAKELRSLGHSAKHILRNIRTAGYTLCKIRRRNGRMGHGLAKADAAKYLASFENTVAEAGSPEINVGGIEDFVRAKREKEGWISFRLGAVGMPDLINLKPRGDGLFEVMFEEAKGPGDALRKDQHIIFELMKEKGIPTTITWL